MTDGKSQNKDFTFDAAFELKKSGKKTQGNHNVPYYVRCSIVFISLIILGVYVIAVRLGRARESELAAIASPPASANVIDVGKYSQLNTILDTLYVLICRG